MSNRTAALCRAGAVALASAVALIHSHAVAAQTIGTDENHIKIGGLLQAWATTTEEGAPDGGTGTEMYLRRMRLIVYGQVSERVSFFVETDIPNFGKNGDWSGRMFIQDAYVEYEAHEALQIAAGMLLVPFSHHGMQGATSLLGLDYHAALIRYPAGSNLVWRDGGVMIRGMPLGNVLEYRLGLFNGVHGNATPVDKSATDASGVVIAQWEQGTDPRNPGDAPRVAGRLTLNLFDPEGGPGVGGMFYDGIYLKATPDGLTSPKTVVAFGGSFDWQRNVNVTWADAPASGARAVADKDDYFAAAGDVFWDVPIGARKIMSVNGQVNFYLYDHGDRRVANAFYNGATGAGSLYTGWGISSEAGFRYDIIQPLVRFDHFESTKADGNAGDYVAVAGGLNAWLSEHTTSIKIEVGAAKSDGDKWLTTGALQAQLLF